MVGNPTTNNGKFFLQESPNKTYRPWVPYWRFRLLSIPKIPKFTQTLYLPLISLPSQARVFCIWRSFGSEHLCTALCPGKLHWRPKPLNCLLVSTVLVGYPVAEGVLSQLVKTFAPLGFWSIIIHGQGHNKHFLLFRYSYPNVQLFLNFPIL